jgi:hypothetical protein
MKFIMVVRVNIYIHSNHYYLVLQSAAHIYVLNFFLFLLLLSLLLMMIMNIENLTIQITERSDVYQYKKSYLQESIVNLHKKDTSASGFKSEKS